MKQILKYAVLALTVGVTPASFAEETKCNKVSVVVKKQVSAAPDNVLAIVEREATANSACVCEIVKAAIVATEANGKLVGQIVATAIEAVPDKMSLISRCAIAVAPDALSQILAVVEKIDPKAVARKGKDPVNTGTNVRSPLEEIYLVPGLPPIHPAAMVLSSTCTPDQFPNVDIVVPAP